jgi:excisionase family DNA binding protein
MSRLEFELDDATLDRLAELVAERLDGHGGPEPWIGVQQAAEHLACKRQRIYDLVHAGRIPHHRDGSRLLFRRSELDRWLERGA